MNTKANLSKRSWSQFKNLLTAVASMLLLYLATFNSAAQTYYKVLHSFNGSDGGVSWASLMLAGSTLYGTAAWGGSSNCGAIFKLNTDGSGYTVLKSFTGGDGMEPRAGLVLAGNTLYGTTSQGGSSDNGVVFKVNTDGLGYGVLVNFNYTNGAAPLGSLVLAGSTLYGTTIGWGWGTVFKVNTDGSGYVILKSFLGHSNNDGGGSACGSGLGRQHALWDDVSGRQFG
jgi:uncharacterized repeat protein (TIGR03803 family)